MSCITLANGLDVSCNTYQKKYHQQVVLVNKQDVLSYNVIVDNDEICRHRILFHLKGGSTGYRFTSTDRGFSVLGRFEKTTKENIAQYRHNIQILMMGVTEEVKCLLKQLDNAEYFAAIQYTDGTIEIYGFDYGLKTSDYVYDAQAGLGGSLILLSSDDDALEDDPPYIYASATPGNENDDFDNNFADNEPSELGDFNFDFNDDFYIGS